MTSYDVSAVRQLERLARYQGRRTAILYEGQALNYREVRDLVALLGAGLRADGVGPGDRIAWGLLLLLVFRRAERRADSIASAGCAQHGIRGRSR